MSAALITGRQRRRSIYRDRILNASPISRDGMIIAYPPWSSHLQSIYSKANSNLGFLGRQTSRWQTSWKTLNDTLSWFVSELSCQRVDCQRVGLSARCLWSGFLRHNLRQCPAKLKESAYISLVRSTLEYATPVWDPHLAKDINKLENIQKRSARFVKSDYRTTSSVTQMLQELGWQDMPVFRLDLCLHVDRGDRWL